MGGHLMAPTTLRIHQRLIWRRSAAIRHRSTANLVTIREAARNAIATLQAIRDETNVTNAEAVAYIKDEARIRSGPDPMTTSRPADLIDR